MFSRLSIYYRNLLPVCLVLLTASSLGGQTADRLGQLHAAQRRMQADSNETAREVFQSVIYDGGELRVDSITGVAYHNLGVLAYYAGDQAAAADYFRRAVEVRDRVFPGPHNERAHSRSNLAYMYRLLDRLDSTALRVREANAIYAELPRVDSLNWLRSLNELGALALSQENYLMGYSSSYRAVALSKEMSSVDPYDAFVTYYRAARILLRLHQPGEALPYAHKAVLLATDLGVATTADALREYYLLDRIPRAYYTYPLLGTDELNGGVNDFRLAIVEGKYRRKSLLPEDVQASWDRRFIRAGSKLAHRLLPAPFREGLHRRAPPAALPPRLIVVPDGALHYLPFAALPLTPADTTAALDYGSVDYLHRHASISYAYSGGYLTRVADRSVDTFTTQLLAFAPSFGGGGAPPTAQASTGGDPLRSGSSLSPLRHNREEVARIAALVAGARTYTGAEATREHFVQHLGSSRVLHLSSHGMVDPQDPNLSFIAFTQGQTLDPDELLYFNDLYAMPLDNELTVLSACETALGEIAPGETTMSMASAFAAAGARSTVTTLWRVDDAATEEVIVDFYRGLVAGKSRATTLHEAQSRQLKTEYAHPYYWSGIMLYGTPDTLSLNMVDADGYLPWWGWLVVAALVAGLLFYLLRFLYRYRPVDL